MKQLLQQAKKRKELLTKVKGKIERGVKKKIPGKLRISRERGNTFYYNVSVPGDTCGTYISKKEAKTIRQLAQQEYEMKFKKALEHELSAINSFISKCEKNNADMVYDNLSLYRKELVNPLLMSEQAFADAWESESFKTTDFYDEKKVYVTEKGEVVRTKSELIIANTYYELGIPYRYEAELRLNNGKRKYPDFTVLNKKTREVIYHEHFGLLDKNDYFLSNLTKLDDYKNSGIFLGKNLIITYESEQNPFDVNSIKRMLKEVFCV